MKNLRSFILSFLVLLVFIGLAPSLDVKASEYDVASIVANLTGSDVPGNLSTYAEGISAVKSGYAIYLVDKNGAGKSPNAVLVTSTSTNYFSTAPDYIWSIKTRLGGYTIKPSNGVFATGVPWGSPVDLSSGWGSRQNEIRNYMATNSDGYTNAWKLCQSIWGTSIADQWATNDWQLVMEPVYTFRGWFKYTLVVESNGSVVYTGDFKTSLNAPYFVGNVQGLASMMNAYIPYYASLNNKVINPYPTLSLTYKYATSLSSSPMSSGYLKGMCHTIKLSSALGGLGVSNLPTSSYLNLSQVNNLGVGIFALSSSSLTGAVVDPDPVVLPDGSYNGYLYTLSATGSNGGTTEASLLQGALDVSNPAQGSDAEALSNSLSSASGASYFGGVAQIAYTGTLVGLKLESTSRIAAGCITAEPSSFYGVTVTSTSQADYQSFADSVFSSIGVDINLQMREGNTVKTTLNFSSNAYQSSGFTSPSYQSETYSPWLNSYNITYDQSRKTGIAPSWTPSNSYDVMCTRFKQVYYNSTTTSGRDLFESTEIYQAFKASTEKYVAMLKSTGVLESAWQSAMEGDRKWKSGKAGQSAKDAWLSNNVAPTYVKTPDELGLKSTDAGYASALAKRTTYDTALASYNASANAEYDKAYNATYSAYVEQSYVLPNFITSNKWVFNIYSTVPVTESSYLLQDKIPIRSGPSAVAGKRFQKGYVCRWVYSMPFNWSGDTSHLITFIPFVSGATTTTPGGVSSFYSLIDTAHVLNADFIVSDATSADMKN